VTEAVSVNLAAVVGNWQILCQKSGPATCGAVVKANAYGLGSARVVSALYQAGCRLFFTAKTHEALPLRPLAPDAEIVVLHGIDEADGLAAQEARLTSVIHMPEQMFWQGPFWLSIDTGMNRLGFAPDDLPSLAGRTPDVVMSHLAVADEPQHFMNVEQLKRFRAVLPHFPNSKASLSASSGIFLGGAYLGHITRAGYALYGGNPTPDQPNPMQPVVTWRGKILQRRTLKVGETAGYGAVWQADRPTTLAVVETGYAQGLPRCLSASGGQVEIEGVRAPIIGRVSMDLVQVDVTDLPKGQAQRGDVVAFLSPTLTVDEVARAAGTIGYAILTHLPQNDLP
jgi:alanine racemase